MELKEAYSQLELEPEAPIEEVEKQYARLMKKYRTAKFQEDADVDEAINQLSMAYNTIKAKEREDLAAKEPKKEYHPFWKKIGLNPERIEHFIYYYKYHTLLIAGLILAGIYMGYIIVSNIRANEFNVVFMGQFISQDDANPDEKLQDALDKTNIDLPPLRMRVLSLYPSGGTEQEVQLANKANAIAAVDPIDLFVLDRRTYEIYASQGAFAYLEPIAGKLGIDLEANQDLYVLMKGDKVKTPKLFGVYVTNSKFMKESGVQGDEFIIAVGVRSPHPDETFELVKKILDQIEK